MVATSEMVVGRPAPTLRGYLSDYQGYRVSGMPKGTHAGLPGRSLTLIVPFDDPLELSWDGLSGRGPTRLRSMIAGLHDKPVTVHHDGRQHGIQIDLTPAGCRALLGCPAGAVNGEAIELSELIGPAGTELVDRLSMCVGWPGRFDILDEVLLRLVGAASMRGELAQAWQLMASTNGVVSVRELADSLGWSRRHLSAQFQAEFGMTPKVMAQVMRFEHANRRLRDSAPPASLAELAFECGYADQAHLNRDFVRFAGAPPTSWLKDPMLFPIVQDLPAAQGADCSA